MVASLVADGWTVAAIADRLCCSLRLVQQIKADPMTNVAGYAIDLNQKLLAERALRALESRVAEQNAVEDALRVSRLTSQRDVLLDQIRNSSLKGTP